MDEVFPVGGPEDQTQFAGAIFDGVVAQMALTGQAKQILELIDGENRGRRVVDRGRQCLESDVNDDPERKRRILLRRSFGTKHHRGGQDMLIQVLSSRVHEEQCFPACDEVSHLRHEFNHAV